MVTKSGELRTYYQRNWGEDFWPNNLTSRSIVTSVAARAIPFLGFFYKPACIPISLGHSFINASVNMTNLFLSEEGCTSQRNKFDLWCFIKNSAEFVGTIASLRIGLAVHTVMNLGENLYASRECRTAPLSQTCDKMFSVVSNALYLLTLVSFSTPVSYGVIGASLVFQTAWSFNKVRAEVISFMKPPKSEEEESVIEAEMEVDSTTRKINIIAHLAMAVICLRETMIVHRAAWPLWQKQNAS